MTDNNTAHVKQRRPTRRTPGTPEQIRIHVRPNNGILWLGRQVLQDNLAAGNGRISLLLRSGETTTELMRSSWLNRHFTERSRIVRLLHRPLLTGLAASLLAGALPVTAGAQDCLFVLNQLNNSVAAVSRASNTIVTTVPLPTDDCPQPPCHPMPTALQLSDDTMRAYVTRQDVSLVHVLDAMAGAVIDSVALDSGSSPAAAALSPNSASLYVANLATDSVSVIATASDAVVDTIQVGDRPRAVAVTPDGATVLVGNGGDDTVSLIRAADGVVIDTLTVGDGPAGVAVTPDGTRAYVTNGSGGTVSVIDIGSRSVLDPIAVGHSPRGVAFAPDGASAYVTNVLDGTVSVIDTAAGAVAGDPIVVGTGPVAVVVSADGATAYVANLTSNTVSAIDTASRAVTTIDQLGSPFDLALGACPVAPTPTATPSPTPTPTVVVSCTGDCNGDGRVVVSELITGVNIALDNQPVSVCPAFDTDGSGDVLVNELIGAVTNALGTCAA